jgi:hypothetical protein
MYFVFTFSELKICKSSTVNTLKAQLIFPFKPIFCNLFEFSEQNPLKNQYLPHLTSENYEINVLNLIHQGLSNNTNNTPIFQHNFQFQFYLIFTKKIVQ